MKTSVLNIDFLLDRDVNLWYQAIVVDILPIMWKLWVHKRQLVSRLGSHCNSINYDTDTWF